MKKFLLRTVLWTWCLLQSFLGMFVYAYVCLADRRRELTWLGNGSLLVNTSKLNGGVSLGFFVFSENYFGQYQAVQSLMNRHEQGHTVQGFVLGPLYLFVIGLPSVVWAGCFEGYRKRKGISYYSFYTEKWADRIAGIAR